MVLVYCIVLYCIVLVHTYMYCTYHTYVLYIVVFSSSKLHILFLLGPLGCLICDQRCKKGEPYFTFIFFLFHLKTSAECRECPCHFFIFLCQCVQMADGGGGVQSNWTCSNSLSLLPYVTMHCTCTLYNTLESPTPPPSHFSIKTFFSPSFYPDMILTLTPVKERKENRKKKSTLCSSHSFCLTSISCLHTVSFRSFARYCLINF